MLILGWILMLILLGTSVDSSKPLYEQLTNGIDFVDNPMLRKLRCLHNNQMKYIPGRHFSNFTP